MYSTDTDSGYSMIPFSLRVYSYSLRAKALRDASRDSWRTLYIRMLGLGGDPVDTACYSLFRERDIKKECYMHRMRN